MDRHVRPIMARCVKYPEAAKGQWAEAREEKVTRRGVAIPNNDTEFPSDLAEDSAHRWG